jgi:hypothetical protein
MNMRFDNEPLDKETLKRLEEHGILLSNHAPPITKEKALVLLGEAMLNEFVEGFVRLWKKELFPYCLLRDYEATEDEIHKILHGD